MRPVTARGVGVVFVAAPALALDVGEHHPPPVKGQLRRQKRTAFGSFAAEVAHPVVIQLPRPLRSPIQALAREPAARDDGVRQEVAHGRPLTERIGKNKQAPARNLCDPVILIATMATDRPVALEKEQLFEIQQRVGEGDTAPEVADAIEQSPAFGFAAARELIGLRA